MLSGVAGKSSMAKRLHLPTISAIIGGKKLSPKKSLEGNISPRTGQISTSHAIFGHNS